MSRYAAAVARLEEWQKDLLAQADKVRRLIESHDFSLAAYEASSLELRCQNTNRLANGIADGAYGEPDPEPTMRDAIKEALATGQPISLTAEAAETIAARLGAQVKEAAQAQRARDRQGLEAARDLTLD